MSYLVHMVHICFGIPWCNHDERVKKKIGGRFESVPKLTTPEILSQEFQGKYRIYMSIPVYEKTGSSFLVFSSSVDQEVRVKFRLRDSKKCLGSGFCLSFRW